MKIAKKIIALINVCLVASLMLMSQASYAVDAGHAQFVSGNVQISSADGQESILKKGDMVREGDTLTTATAASAQIKMLDGGLIAVRSDTKLKFDTFKFNGTQDGSERSFFSLFKGGFRAVTGLIGKLHKSNFHITTAAAVIGIRGTDHETYVVTAGSPMAAVAPIGTYNKVNWGETTMTTDRGTISVLPNQMGYVSAADQMPELKPLNTNIFTITSRPLAKVKASDKEEQQLSKTAAADKSEKKEIAAESVPVAVTTIIDPATTIIDPVTTINDPVTTINWGRWNDNMTFTLPNNSNGLAQGAGAALTHNPNIVGANQNGPASQLLKNDNPTFTLPNNSNGLAQGAGAALTHNPNTVGTNQNGPAAQLLTNDNPTFTLPNNSNGLAQGAGAALTHNPNIVGANQNGPASQLLINDNTVFTLPNNSTGLAHRNSGRRITP
jgi:hypothetical protein